MSRRHVVIELQYFFVDPVMCVSGYSSSSSSTVGGTDLLGHKPGGPHQHPPVYMRASSDGNIINGSVFAGLYGRNMRGGDGNDGANSDRVIRQKLMPYLDGRTPMCEILWLEDLTEDVVLATVRKSPNIIINIRPIKLVQGY